MSSPQSFDEVEYRVGNVSHPNPGLHARQDGCHRRIPPELGDPRGRGLGPRYPRAGRPGRTVLRREVQTERLVAQLHRVRYRPVGDRGCTALARAGQGGRAMTQTHDHDHGAHAPIQSSSDVSEFEVLELAVRELAIEKGLFSAEDHRRFSEWAESIGPSGGSKLVAKASVEPDFKARLLADGTVACKEVGIDWLDPTGTGTPSDYTYFYVLENTPTVHNVIVCKLRSCYPRPVLGMSPDWYRTPNYRRRLVRWPREVLAEFGLHFGQDVEVRVHDSNQKSRFMVMPMRPEGTEGWTEEQLEAIVTRDTMIGVALPHADWTADRSPSAV